jgi:hypothetical protein
VRSIAKSLAQALGTSAGVNGHVRTHDVRNAARLVQAHDAVLRASLEELTCDDRLAADVAARSYWHSNGFAKLVVHVDDVTGSRLRLHVWPQAGRRGAGYQNVHNHRWPFLAVVLCGAVRVQLFEEVDLPAGDAQRSFVKYVYDAGAPTLIAPFREVARRALRDLGDAVYEAGEAHSCSTIELHTVTANVPGTTVTLLIQGPVQRRSALVYQHAGRPLLEDTGERIAPKEVSDLVSMTLAAMGPDFGTVPGIPCA